MIRSILTVSTGTLASRLLGFARDAMIAALLGTGAGRRRLPGGVSTGQRRAAAADGRRIERGAGPGLAARARRRRRNCGGGVFAGRVLGTISAALIAATAVIGLAMPLVITALAPGFAGHDTLQLAVNDARLMLPYLAFAGPATVMMALLNAQGRFALTAFSPLTVQHRADRCDDRAVVRRENAAPAALAIAATVGIAGLPSFSILVLRRWRPHRHAAARQLRCRDARLFRPRPSPA